jgi:cell filamentation protein
MHTPSNKLGIKDEKVLEKVEGALTSARIAEILEMPVPDYMNEEYLRYVHHYIFQDLYDHAGKFHKSKTTRIKHRMSELTGSLRSVFYPSVDAIHCKLPNLLNSKSIETLYNSGSEFIKNLCFLYSELDYIHPFEEGNSRTLRLIASQIALSAGYKLNWSVTNLDVKSRELLYAARDKYVLKKVIHDVKTERELKLISRSIHDVQNAPNLLDLFVSMISLVNKQLSDDHHMDDSRSNEIEQNRHKSYRPR